MQKADEELVQQARMVLDFNWTGEYTMPGPRLYPHQWSWDSALIAIGYSRYDQERGVKELSHLFESQWKSGLLPQIVFNPLFGEYFPGMEFWHAERSPDAPRDRKTSGVVQPPDRNWQPTLIVTVEPGRDPGQVREYRVLGCRLYYYYHRYFR